MHQPFRAPSLKGFVVHPAFVLVVGPCDMRISQGADDELPEEPRWLHEWAGTLNRGVLVFDERPDFESVLGGARSCGPMGALGVVRQKPLHVAWQREGIHQLFVYIGKVTPGRRAGLP